ncbi:MULTISPECIES: DEAD/DEAH box helicase [unclassified Achromobacter]|uniref:DEAD/DEAH box helicase n=1 Tax=unclassified Achromobacter TaxID=2626865 RepID=UPI000B51891C|nr:MULTISPECIES: DEAD/DEAH box helicase [unclassified Achromobacter]OWT71360.1 ATP-dependent RNA helicase [Achromobacter sp. HZ34]OWT73325.1 ATP-dependent RNA helicase [Achromobacter sp. HZ28]
MTETSSTAAPTPADIATPAPTFADFGLHPSLLQSIADTGYTTPTPIQAEAIPVVVGGRDVMGAAQTGTGKTAAFTLPILHRLMPLSNSSASPARHPVRALMLTPTRELADQVFENVKRYSARTPLRAAVVFGGVDIGPQKEALRNGCEVLVATPGRLLDHVEQKNVNLGQVSVLVLDEADRMLDMGFLPDLDRIIRLLPQQRQNLLFSATFSNEIRKLARSFQNNPVEIEVAGRNATADTVTQIAYPMTSEGKRAAVVHLVKSRNLSQVIVFSNTKIGTARLARQLEKDGVRAESIHGDKSQADRMKALEAFKAGELEVLVATDVAARGLDVAGVPCVINYDLPYNAEDYVHRIGRTGRAGASGEAIALFTPSEERLLLDIEKLIKRAVPRGQLELPADLLARSHGRGGEPETGGRERRGGRDGRDGRDRSEDRDNRGSGSRRRYNDAPSRPPIDDFFLRPYEPSPAAVQADAARPEAGSDERAGAPKRKVAVLLGGSRKPS